MLTFPGSVSILQGRKNCNYALQAGVDVGMAASIATGFGQSIAKVVSHDRRQARLGLYRRRKGGAISPGRRLSITADGNIDDGWIVGLDVLVAKAEAA